MANKFAVFTISMFGLVSAISSWSPVWAEETKEESKGTIGDFFKKLGKNVKDNTEGIGNQISDHYGDVQQQIFKVNDGSRYHCVANSEGKFYAPGKAQFGHTAFVNKKLVFVDDSGQQVGNKIRVDVLKSISGGDCAKLMQAGKLVRLDGPGGAGANSGTNGRNTVIVGYYVGICRP